jgi:hypothetical protein
MKKTGLKKLHKLLQFIKNLLSPSLQLHRTIVWVINWTIFSMIKTRTLEEVDTYANKYNISVRKMLPHCDGSQGTRQADKCPLLARAWSYQERVLSSRVLHFCTEELFQNCMEH